MLWIISTDKLSHFVVDYYLIHFFFFFLGEEAKLNFSCFVNYKKTIFNDDNHLSISLLAKKQHMKTYQVLLAHPQNMD